jgi:hypothetical protein
MLHVSLRVGPLDLAGRRDAIGQSTLIAGRWANYRLWSRRTVNGGILGVLDDVRFWRIDMGRHRSVDAHIMISRLSTSLVVSQSFRDYI